jgi:hypothetical protein
MFRTLIGVLAFLAIAWVIFAHQAIIARRHTPELSAIQVIQIYTEGCFYIVGVIGMAIGAYVASRCSS